MQRPDKNSPAILYLRFSGSRRMIPALCVILMAAGGAAFLSGIAGPYPQAAWQAYMVNFLFWTGLAFGAILFVAIMNMTHARWSRPIKRLAEAPAAFLPVLFLLFVLMYGGRDALFPWLHEPAEGKTFWLNAGFLFVRNAVGLLLLMTVSLALLYQSVRGDSEAAAGSHASAPVLQKRWRRQIALSPALGILYAFVLSLLAFDFIMSLDPHWYSTLFGAYYFIGSFYTALAALAILTAAIRSTPGMEHYLSDRLLHDLGKLLFGFCCMTGYLFYVQFLVIWYGNLPEETRYIILRIRTSPWEPLAWAVLVLIFIIPFVTLLSRKIKSRPGIMALLGSLILIGMWLERYLLIAPSLMKGRISSPGMTEVLISAGFLGAMALTVIWFLRTFPLLPVSDPLFRETFTSSPAETERTGT